MQPKVDTIMSTANAFPPHAGKICCSIAVATRSLGACWIAGKFSTARYATFAARYNSITMTVPMARDFGSVVLGSLTSSAAKVTSCHESAAKRDPDWETQNTTMRLRMATNDTPG